MPCEQRSEAPDPDPDSLVGDDDPSLGKSFLDVAKAEGERKKSQIACRMMVFADRNSFASPMVRRGYTRAATAWSNTSVS